MPRLLSFSGKSDRFEWWVVSLIADLFAQLAVVGVLAAAGNIKSLHWLAGGGIVVFEIFCVWLAVAVTVRRLRDRERSLWLLLAALIPYVGALWLLVECGFLPAPGGPCKRRLVRRVVTTGGNSASGTSYSSDQTSDA